MTRAGVLPWGLLAVAGAFLWARSRVNTSASSAPLLAPLTPVGEGVYSAAEYARTVMTGSSRGIRNNNPGNIRRTAEKWQGMTANQTDPSFVQFVAPEYGIRALAILLRNYGRAGYRTLATVIARYAPAADRNNVQAYVDSVRAETGLPATQLLNLSDRAVVRSVMTAIIKHENGSQPYDASIIERGLDLAGF